MKLEYGLDWIVNNKRLSEILDECNKLPLGQGAVMKILVCGVVSNKD
jgi:hypothetical protein